MEPPQFDFSFDLISKAKASENENHKIITITNCDVNSYGNETPESESYFPIGDEMKREHSSTHLIKEYFSFLKSHYSSAETQSEWPSLLKYRQSQTSVSNLKDRQTKDSFVKVSDMKNAFHIISKLQKNTSEKNAIFEQLLSDDNHYQYDVQNRRSRSESSTNGLSNHSCTELSTQNCRDESISYVIASTSNPHEMKYGSLRKGLCRTSNSDANDRMSNYSGLTKEVSNSRQDTLCNQLRSNTLASESFPTKEIILGSHSISTDDSPDLYIKRSLMNARQLYKNENHFDVPTTTTAINHVTTNQTHFKERNDCSLLETNDASSILDFILDSRSNSIKGHGDKASVKSSFSNLSVIPLPSVIKHDSLFDNSPPESSKLNSIDRFHLHPSKTDGKFEKRRTEQKYGSSRSALIKSHETESNCKQRDGIFFQRIEGENSSGLVFLETENSDNRISSTNSATKSLGPNTSVINNCCLQQNLPENIPSHDRLQLNRGEYDGLQMQNVIRLSNCNEETHLQNSADAVFLMSCKCKVCQRRYGDVFSLNFHIYKVHERNTRKTCFRCSAEFITLYALLHHLKIHRRLLSKQTSVTSVEVSYPGTPDCQLAKIIPPNRAKVRNYHQWDTATHTLFHCGECWNGYSHKKSLMSHVRLKHLGLVKKTHKCGRCSKSFSSRWQLNNHVSWWHLGKKPYICQLCGQGFVCLPTLRRHQRKIHTGDKPYRCIFCQESFIEKAPLDLHKAQMHTGIFPFRCSHCGRGFVQRCYLKVHLKIHANFRPYKCSDCDKQYSKISHLKRHRISCSKKTGNKKISGIGKKNIKYPQKNYSLTEMNMS